MGSQPRMPYTQGRVPTQGWSNFNPCKHSDSVSGFVFPLNPSYPSPLFKRPLLLLLWVCKQKPVYSGFSVAWSEGPYTFVQAQVPAPVKRAELS